MSTAGLALLLAASVLPGPLPTGVALAGEPLLAVNHSYEESVQLRTVDLRNQRSDSVVVTVPYGTDIQMDAIRVLDGPGTGTTPAGLGPVRERRDVPCLGRWTKHFCWLHVEDTTGAGRGQRVAAVEFVYRTPATSSVVQTVVRQIRWTAAVPPSAPGLTVEPGPGPGQVSVAITDPTDDGGSPLRLVEVEGWEAGTEISYFWNRVPPRDPGPTRLVFSSLPAGTTLEVFASGWNDIGLPGALSAGVLVVVPGVPSSPDPVRVRRPLAQPVTVSWSVPADDGGAPVDHYEVHRRDGQGPEKLVVRTTALSWQDHPGLPGTGTWSYRVRAVTRYGAGEHSAAVQAPLLDLP